MAQSASAGTALIQWDASAPPVIRGVSVDVFMSLDRLSVETSSRNRVSMNSEHPPVNGVSDGSDEWVCQMCRQLEQLQR